MSQKSQFIDHFRFLNKEARLWVWVVLVLSLVGTALDAVGIGLFYPVITGKSIQEIFSNGWLKELLNFMESSGLSLSSKNLVMIVIVIFAVRALFKYLEHVLNEYIKVRATKNLRLEMADLLERMNGPLVLSLKSGEQLTLALNETNQILQSLAATIHMLTLVVSTLGYAIMALLSNWRVTVIGTMIGFIGLILLRKNAALTSKYSDTLVKANRSFSNQYKKVFDSLRYFKESGYLKPILTNVRTQVIEISHFQKKIAVLSGMTYALTQPFAVISVLSIIAVESYLNPVGFAAAVVALAMMYRLLGNLMAFQGCWQSFSQISGSIEAVFENHRNLAKEIEIHPRGAQFTFKQNIEFKSVSFKINDRKIFSEFNLMIERNKIIAITGQMGAGKSLLFDLLTGLFVPNEGDILIDGVSLKSIDLSKWRSQVGILPQDPVILDDTIKNNIVIPGGVRHGASGTANFVNGLKAAARLAKCDQWIDSLPLGYETRIGEGGLFLSPGQEQRIAMARALYGSPLLILMDEPTSSLDSDSEQLFVETFKKHKNKTTIVLVTRKRSLIELCDQVVLIENGKVKAQGKAQEILSQIA